MPEFDEVTEYVVMAGRSTVRYVTLDSLAADNWPPDTPVQLVYGDGVRVSRRIETLFPKEHPSTS